MTPTCACWHVCLETAASIHAGDLLPPESLKQLATAVKKVKRDDRVYTAKTLTGAYA